MTTSIAKAFIFLAIGLLPAGAFAAARQDAAVSSLPDTRAQADRLYQEGIASLGRGDLVTAIARFERVLKLLPNSPDAHNSLGFALVAQ
ncbi:MAG TPA: tetratricopeptide repeat protein, partial [Candidatus Acidoferrum sp.]